MVQYPRGYRVKKQLDHWSKKNQNDEASKFYEVLESLTKNDKIVGLSDYISGTVCEKFKDDIEPTVAKLIKCLDNRYLKTAFERVNDFIQDFYDFGTNVERDPAGFFDRLESLSIEIS